MLQRSISSIGTAVMKLLKKLYNPFVLAGEGFVLGAILFLTAHPETRQSIADSIQGAPVAASVQDGAI